MIQMSISIYQIFDFLLTLLPNRMSINRLLPPTWPVSFNSLLLFLTVTQTVSMNYFLAQLTADHCEKVMKKAIVEVDERACMIN
jgi:hypothetical protein